MLSCYLFLIFLLGARVEELVEISVCVETGCPRICSKVRQQLSRQPKRVNLELVCVRMCVCACWVN